MILFIIHVLTAFLGVIFTIIMVTKILQFPDTFSAVERWGMALSGGTMILRIPTIIVSPETTPFSDWATLAMTLGMVMMSAGRLARLMRHARNNTRAVDAAEAHLRSRGKL